jgi:hypothetical protein
MDAELAGLLKGLASQGVFALLFGYLGHRQLKQYDRLQEQNDKKNTQLFELTKQSLERDKANMDMMGKMGQVLDKVSQRLDK